VRRRPPLGFGLAAGWLALLGFLGEPLGEARPEPPELRAGLRLTVTSGRDSGPGSLREAILTADRSPERVRIDVLAPRVQLESGLPPLVGSRGVILLGGSARVEIDGSGVSAGSLLDIASPRSHVEGLRFRGAADQAVLVRAAGTTVRTGH
jgi:hypothetical protein